MTNIDQQALRDAFGSFMTGVTVVTANDANGQPVGFTANSFTSVSMQPPLLLVCPSKTLSFLEAFSDTDSFCVNILASHQQDVSSLFASFQGDRFKHVGWQPDQHGCAIIDHALAYFSCKRFAAYEGGDHIIFVGEVVAFDEHEKSPLVFHGGAYAEAKPKPSKVQPKESIDVEQGRFTDEFLLYLVSRAHFQASFPTRKKLKSSLMT